MHVQKLTTLARSYGFTINYVRLLSTTTPKHLNQKWREERGLPMNPNACGVLTDKPDYSFVSGKPTPYGMRQTKRLVKQKELAEKIMALSEEIDFAVERNKNLKIEEEKRRQSILDRKLKPKGLELLKK